MLLLKFLAVFAFYVQWIECSAGGESTTYRKQDDSGNYAFGYDINDGKGGNNFHKESGDEYGNKRGSYGILGADGKMRIVHYIADKDGFRVDIKSNEQGMKTGVDSANAIVNGKDPEHPSDYSSEFGMRTAGYSAPVASPLYLSSSSHHPSSKPYYPSSLAYHPPAHTAHVPPPPPPPPTPAHIPVKPESIYSSYAHRMHLLPKNLAYTPKSISYSPAPKYGSIYDDNPTSAYESGHRQMPPQPVHPVTYTPESRAYSSPGAYNDHQPYADPMYGLTSSQADSYHPTSSGGYGLRKSALTSSYPQTGYSKVSGYEKRKHRHSTKYLNEPLHAYGSHHSSAAASPGHPDTSILRPGTLRTSSHTSPDHAQLVASYRTEQRHSDESLPVKGAKSAHLFDSSLYKSAKKKK